MFASTRCGVMTSKQSLTPIILLHAEGDTGGLAANITNEISGSVTMDQATTSYSTGAKFGYTCFSSTAISYLHTAVDSRLVLGTRDFTFEGWFKDWTHASASAGVSPFFTQQTSSGNYLSLYVNQVDDGIFLMYRLDNFSLVVTLVVDLTHYTQSDWNHIALVRSADVLTVYMNGYVAATSTLTSGASFEADNYYLAYGDAFSRSDEIRVCIGAAYTAPFTPPTESFLPASSYVPTVSTTVFTSSGDLVLTESTTLDYLIVAGGGGGAGSYYDGGPGGGGGVLQGTVTLAAGTYPIVVGAGGAATTATGIAGNKGGNSSFNGLVAIGGGPGGNYMNGGADLSGGSTCGSGYGYAAGTPTSGQGNKGGVGAGAPSYRTGGAGGAGEAGYDYYHATKPGYGGDGIISSISGTATYYAGGGGCGCYTEPGAPGGLGGGGAGAPSTSLAGISGTANTGGGGGGAWTHIGNTNGSAGGSGIVIIAPY